MLLLGETGTGKEVLADAIHGMSSRKHCPIVKVNCAALPASLIESELFGREKGAYTGALARQIGRFQLANRATLFLDEVGELPLDLQTKLLRVLQDGRFERVGSTKTIEVDIRLISATNHDVTAAVAGGRFREDLYCRPNVFPVAAPPLRERPEDIPLLAWEFVKVLSEATGKPIERIAEDSISALHGRCDIPACCLGQFMVNLWSGLASRKATMSAKVMHSAPRLLLGAAPINYLRNHDEIGWAMRDEDRAGIGERTARIRADG